METDFWRTASSAIVELLRSVGALVVTRLLADFLQMPRAGLETAAIWKLANRDLLVIKFNFLEFLKIQFSFFTGTTCRGASGECDLPEYCNGEQEFCPTDVFKRDADECRNGKAFCYQGSCKLHDDQCKLLWGPSGSSLEQCYKDNAKGDRFGNCGFDFISKRYTRCELQDVMCGTQQCQHLSERLEYGFEQLALNSTHHVASKYSNDTLLLCHTTNIDLGYDNVDPGMTPNGAKCGDNRMCFDQKCVDIEKLKLDGKVISCPDCNGNGVCNSEGHCHCDEGWAPPHCNEPGFGGSSDSGPASDPDGEFDPHQVDNSSENYSLPSTALLVIKAGMYIFFLGLIPCFLLLTALFSYFRRANPNFTRQSSVYVAKATRNIGTRFNRLSKRHIGTGVLMSSTNANVQTRSMERLHVDENEEFQEVFA